MATSQEARILLALQALKDDKYLSLRRAAKDYNVPKTTLCSRRQGIAFRRDSRPNSMKLTQSEEEAITKRILDLDSRGFPPTLGLLRDMANKLLAERQQDPVGEKWPTHFIQCNPRLQTRWSRAYDRQRASNEDPEKIHNWFDLVKATVNQYGIVNQDIYNFDETGFCMGQISATVVITSAERRAGKAKTIQPGNREWTTVIQGVSTGGWVLPPYVIFAGKYHQQAWYEGPLPTDWTIAVR